MPGNWPSVTNVQAVDATRRNGQSQLPAPGSVVMAGVEEDHGDGVYTIRWGGNRLTVASQAKLTPGSTLILKAELSPEGKTMLVVQGPALPVPGVSVIAANYGPPRQIQESHIQEPPPGEAGAGEEASASGGALRTDGGAPAGAVLKPLLEQLPDVFRHSQALLEAAVADLERMLGKAAETARGERGEHALPEGGGPEKKPPLESSADPGAPPAAGRPPGEPAAKVPDAATVARTLEALKEAALRLAAAEGAPPEARPASRQPPGEGAPAGARPLPASAAELPPPSASDAGGARPETPPVAGQPASPPPASPAAGSPAAPPAAASEAPPVPASPVPDAGQGGRPAHPDAPPAQTSDAPPPAPSPSASPAAGSSAPPAAGPAVVPEARPVPAPAVVDPPPPVSDASQGRPARPDAPSPAPSPPVSPAVESSAPPVAGSAVVPEARPVPASAVVDPPPVSDAGQGRPAHPAAPPAQTAAGQTPAPAFQAGLPEGVVAEVLHQLAKTAELPLGGGVAEIAADSGGRGPAPAAMVDKAASILLTAAGLTPGPATLEAAKALMERNAPVDRNAVQLMLSLAAGTEGAEREATLKAAARLIAHDVPVSQPLVNGLADVLSREAGIAKLIAAADTALAGPVGVPEVKPFAEAARELLSLLSVDLESEGASSALERFVSSFGRETLARALSMVEAATQAALEAHPDLPKIDAALTEVLSRLSGGDASARADRAAIPADGGAVPLPDAGGAGPEAGSGTAARTPGRAGDAAALPASPAPALEPLPHPGANTPAVELFRPGGPVEKFLTDAGKRPLATPDDRDVDKAVSDLLSDAPDRQRRAVRDLVNRDQPFLREIASRLVAAERSAMRSEPLLARLAEAAGSIRELGRQLIAVKAENIAGQDRNPGVMLAEVPLRMGDSGGDGRMQMFYRKGGSAKGGWSSRVILDLNTSVLGPVLGDMRFSGRDMTLNMFVDKKETADFLARAGGELADKLRDKGFRLKTRFLVLPPPPPPAAEGPPEQPRQKDGADPRLPSPPTGVRTRRGRLDTKA